MILNKAEGVVAKDLADERLGISVRRHRLGYKQDLIDGRNTRRQGSTVEIAAHGDMVFAAQ